MLEKEMGSLEALLSECGLADVNFSKSLTESSKPLIVLNMIVKNESKIIVRLIQSVLSIIDSYCICDTGSTDNTKELIEQTMKEAGKPGEVYVEPFKNFGYNRSHALKRADDWGDYALLLDADMKLVITDKFSATDLKKDGYSIIQKGGDISYYNTRFIKLRIGAKCTGPTHEYYDFPKGSDSGQLDTVYIEDIGDGGSKADKFTRDVKLLSDALIEEPNNERYHFYLAQSYKDSGKPEEAIKHYKRRVELGGWHEEVFFSLLQIGHLYNNLNEKEKAVYYWLEAYGTHPKRAESIYEIVKYYRFIGKHRLAYEFYEIGRKIPYPKDDVLFIRTDVYKHLFEYEFSILAYYLNKPVDHKKYLDLIFSGHMKHNVFENYKFYHIKLVDLPGASVIDFSETVTKTIGGRDDTFVSSSPSLLKMGGGYLMNVRYVNYKIHPDGSYKFMHNDGKITTLQKTVILDKDMKTLQTAWIDKVHDTNLRYQGVEDVKIFQNDGKLVFLGTVEHPVTHNVTVGYGIYDSDMLKPTSCISPTGNGCEKNWVYCANDKTHVVYSWNPLTIGRLENDTFVSETSDTAVPDFFRDVRGSSNGFTFGDEIWFLCHVVHHSSPRQYYHIIVVLDKMSLKFKRHSILFKFNGKPIEYSLGLIVEDERICMSYSQNDSTSAIVSVPMTTVLEKLF
jgi:tetratricopeptide (TPR) repeat protein